MSFKDNGFEVVPNILSLEICNFLADLMTVVEFRSYERIKKNKWEHPIGDEMVRECHASYGSPFSDTLLLKLQPIVERITEKELYPAYSFSRIYYQNASLYKHVDRPSCEYSVTLTLRANGEIWPFNIRSLKGDVSTIKLAPGTGVVYNGCECEHWRDAYTQGKEQHQIFLHYVDKNGKYSNYKYDGRPGLGLPFVQGPLHTHIKE